MYRLYEPFSTFVNDDDTILNLTQQQVHESINAIMKHCSELERIMHTKNIKLRPNKIFVHSIDIDYDYPENYNFIKECKNFIMSSGFIVFQHLHNFEIVKKYLEIYKLNLPLARHPLTGDTLWHLSPFLIDMLHVNVINVYNFRGETPNERRLLAELLHFPQIGKFPLDIDNSWDMKSQLFVDKQEERQREPVALCNNIRKNGRK